MHLSRCSVISGSVFGIVNKSIGKLIHHEKFKDELNTNKVFIKNRTQQFFNIGGKKRTLPRRFIYCTGSLLKAIQLSDIFPDSKTFLDKKLKFPVYDVLMNYEKLLNIFGNQKLTVEALSEFISDNFEDSKELEIWMPPDWKPNPHIINRISDEELRKWAIEVNAQWTYLGRKISANVASHPEQYSFIPVPHGFLLSGEKFKELYYWESYWIVNGLLKCNMWDTAKDIIKNFLYLIEKYGYVPSGTRIYFRFRSNPPLLTMMMESYYNHTKDIDFLKQSIELLEKEMEFWKKFRSIIVRKKGFEYFMYQYNVQTEGPRPEAYRLDIESSILTETEQELEEHFTAIKSAAESGWNISTRWYVLRGYNHGNITNIRTQNIVPVDLNAFMHKNYTLLSKWYLNMGDKIKAKKYQWEAENLLRAIEVVLWNEDEGMWLDYDLSNNIQRNYFYLSNLVPLWTMSYKQTSEKMTEHVLNYFSKYKLNSFKGGVPVSLEDSGELWDYPNCWPILQAFLVQGIDRLDNKTASKLSFNLANKFISNCFLEFKLRGTTLQFYDCRGEGINLDENSIQGYSCTNGVIFEFLDRWGEKLCAPDNKVDKKFFMFENNAVN